MFKIGDLFEKIKVKSLKYKTSELPSLPKNEFVLPALTAGVQNQGLNNFVPIKNATVLKNVISISANGANTGATFYQNKEFTVLQDAYAIDWIYTNDCLTDKQYIYLTSSISKTIFGNYEWTNKAGWEKVKKEKIQLPIKKNKINSPFMENFIAQLEAYHIAQLEAYLLATGLKDYFLTDEEQRVLDNFENGKIKFGEFKIGDLFEKIKVKSLKYKTSELPSLPKNEFVLPALTAGVQNQGLNNFVPIKNATVLKNVISISANGANTGATFYQNKEFTVLQDAYAIDWIYTNDCLTDKQYIYLTSSISKTIFGNYEWTNKAGWEKVKKEKIQLPIKNKKPDYKLMEILISAIQKSVIKDVVLYADKETETTKRVVNK